MAMALCNEEHRGPPNGKKYKYVKSVLPVGYPNTAVICGRKGCRNPGKVWLAEREADLYANGERIFLSVPREDTDRPNEAASAKIRVL